MTILIVIPVLTLLMFELGLTLVPADFRMVAKRPRTIVTGLIGQLLLLPVIAYILGTVFQLDVIFFLGLILIACSPGGSSSNVFSMLVKGDVALSVSLTACSSLITLITIPIVMTAAAALLPGAYSGGIEMPIGKLIVQNIVLTLLPVSIGMLIRRKWETAAKTLSRILEKAALPLLVLLVAVFYSQNSAAIIDHLPRLGVVVTLLILLAIGGGMLLSHLSHLNRKEHRTLVIEIGMQNAAQAIAMASSPFVFNNETMAIPAIIYSLMMNVVLITYVLIVKNSSTDT